MGDALLDHLVEGIRLVHACAHSNKVQQAEIYKCMYMTVDYRVDYVEEKTSHV